MKEWFSHNTDKLLLFVLVICLGNLVLHMVHHGVDNSVLDWGENEFSTVLGALILILTGRISRADGQTANGQPPTATAPAGTTTVTTTQVPTNKV